MPGVLCDPAVNAVQGQMGLSELRRSKAAPMTVLVHMASTALAVVGVIVMSMNAAYGNGGAAMSGVCILLAGIVLRWSNNGV